jgi:hypothetical protein
MKIARASMYTLVASALIMAAPVIVAAPAQADHTDDMFINALSKNGIPYGTPSKAIRMAHEVCNLLSTPGQKGLQDAAAYLQQNTTFDQDDMVAFGGAAVNAYCPENAPS